VRTLAGRASGRKAVSSQARAIAARIAAAAAAIRRISGLSCRICAGRCWADIGEEDFSWLYIRMERGWALLPSYATLNLNR
jgi:hypothetical protein